MIIPKKTLKRWSDLREEGDISKLAKAINKSEPTVHRILKDGKATVTDAEKINEFFRLRKRRVDKITEDNN